MFAIWSVNFVELLIWLTPKLMEPRRTHRRRAGPWLYNQWSQAGPIGVWVYLPLRRAVLCENDMIEGEKKRERKKEKRGRGWEGERKETALVELL